MNKEYLKGFAAALMICFCVAYVAESSAKQTCIETTGKHCHLQYVLEDK